MNYKSLIQHAQNLLGNHSLFGLKDSLQNKSKISVFNEEDILKKYIDENQCFTNDEKLFLQKVFFGSIRYHSIITPTLETFYTITGSKQLRSKYNFFVVICYICLIHLETISFENFSSIIHSCPATDVYPFLKMIFDVDLLNGGLKEEWEKVLDHNFVKDNVIDVITGYIPDSQLLLKNLSLKTDEGYLIKKTKKKATEPAPFELTVPHPRRFSTPNLKISNVFKAAPIPKSFYEGTGEKTAIENAKLENKKKSQTEQQNTKQFQVSKRITADKEKYAKEHERIRLQENKPIPKFKYQPPPKLINKPQNLTKQNIASILREDAIVRRKKKNDDNILNQALVNLTDLTEYQKKVDQDIEKDNFEMQLKVEKRHLEIQLLHEDSYVARKEKERENREIVKELIEEKNTLKSLTVQTKQEEEAIKKKIVEEVHEIKENITKARRNVMDENLKKASDLALETQALKAQALAEAQIERERKVELIHQIRMLEKQMPGISSHQKVVDLTETSGFGLLNEMCIVELQERLLLARVRHQEMEEKKREEILENKTKRLSMIAKKLQDIDTEREERKNQRKDKEEESKLALDAALSLKRAVLKEDPILKTLFEKLEAKRLARKSLSSTGVRSIKTFSNSKSNNETCESGIKSTNLQKSRNFNLQDFENEYLKRKENILKKRQTLIDKLNENGKQEKDQSLNEISC
ncbi:hypothetical protein HDU92_001589 [Lobulomyces angularis]|nr:hypothetical protein HDU92_001589 [Lobulomyces angularis]